MQDQKNEWRDKVEVFNLYYMKKKNRKEISQQKGIPEEVVSQCIKDVWAFLDKERKKG